jgi:hypothetical protein
VHDWLPPAPLVAPVLLEPPLLLPPPPPLPDEVSSLEQAERHAKTQTIVPARIENQIDFMASPIQWSLLGPR